MWKSSQPISYQVPPVLVVDLVTQCAAHYLLALKAAGIDHMRAVNKAGLHGPGGLVEDVDRWCQECAAAAAMPEGSSRRWNVEANGPWLYDDIPPMDIAAAVQRHTRGWALKDFAAYGETVGGGP